MLKSIQEREKLRHPNYAIMELRDDILIKKLNSWTRIDLIDWLSWNDRNGIYKDEDSLQEFNNILSREEAVEIMVRQITEA